MGDQSNGRRVAMSMSADQAEWLDQLLTTLARGGDARVLMRHRIASDVRRIASSASRRSGTLVARMTAKHNLVLEAARAIGRDASRAELREASGLNDCEVHNALKHLRMHGLLKHVGPRGSGNSAWRVMPAAEPCLVARLAVNGEVRT